MSNYMVRKYGSCTESISEARSRIISDLTSFLGIDPVFNRKLADMKADFNDFETGRRVQVYSLKRDDKGKFYFDIKSKGVKDTELEPRLENSLLNYVSIGLVSSTK